MHLVRPTVASMNKEKKAALEAVLHQAGLMANCCFNLSQPTVPLTDYTRKKMGETQKAYDQALCKYREFK